MRSGEPLTLTWPLKTALAHLFQQGVLETPIQLCDGVDRSGEAGLSPQGHGGKQMWYLKRMVLKEGVRLAGWERTAREEGKFRPSGRAIQELCHCPSLVSPGRGSSKGEQGWEVALTLVE